MVCSCGRENTFPGAFITRVNDLGREHNITAELVKLGGTRMDEPNPYRVIVDRISHEIPYYRAYLKQAVLEGTIVINNPFWWSADDKFFECALATKLGVAVPKTVVLPQKSYVEGVVTESLRNLVYPIPWQELVGLRRAARLPEAVHRRRLEERLQDPLGGGADLGLRSDRPAGHDPAGGHHLGPVRALLLPGPDQYHADPL